MKKYAACLIAAFAVSGALAEGVVDFQHMPSNNGVTAAWGFGAYGLGDEGFGFYGNLLVSGGERKPMYESLTVASFGDAVTARYKDPTVLNIGITKKFGTNAAAYVGGGYASVIGKAQKYDPSHILGKTGTYYVNDPAEDKRGLNVNAGLLFMVNKISINVGYNSFLSTATFGAGFKF